VAAPQGRLFSLPAAGIDFFETRVVLCPKSLISTRPIQHFGPAAGINLETF
jgi:hypothetical protein